MKKFLLVLPIILFVAAGCSLSGSSQKVSQQTPLSQKTQAPVSQEQTVQSTSVTPLSATTAVSVASSAQSKREVICAQVINQNYRDYCYQLMAREFLSPELCKKVINDSNRESCYSALSGFVPERTICDNITQESDRTKCLEAYGGKTGKLEDCQTDRCVVGVAVYQHDLSLCSQTKSDGYKRYCYKQIAADTSNFKICDQYTNNNSSNELDSCYSGVVSQLKLINIDICKKLQYSSGTCFTVVAFKTGDVSVCDNIQNKGSIESCVENVSTLNNDILGCRQITDSTVRSGCFGRVVGSTFNPQTCSDIKNLSKSDTTMSGYLDSCYRRIGSVNEDVKYCELISSELVKNDCFLQLAKIKKDPNLCVSIIDANTQKSCYVKLAEENKNLYICDNIDQIKNKDLCYFDVSTLGYMLFGNSDLCNKISDQTLADSCRNQFIKK